MRGKRAKALRDPVSNPRPGRKHGGVTGGVDEARKAARAERAKVKLPQHERPPVTAEDRNAVREYREAVRSMGRWRSMLRRGSTRKPTGL